MGKEETVHGLTTYVVGNQTNPRGIIVMYSDVFGLQLPNNKIIADAIAKGGDWLVYPGDPLRFHSHFVATVLPAPRAPLRPMEIVAHGRLGTATRKAHLLCGYDPASGAVSYLSVEWAGFG